MTGTERGSVGTTFPRSFFSGGFRLVAFGKAQRITADVAR